jgi:hypothetical protein
VQCKTISPPPGGVRTQEEVKKAPFENLSNDQLKEFLRILKADVPKSTLVLGGSKSEMAGRIKEYVI